MAPISSPTGWVIGTMAGLRGLPHGRVTPQERSRATAESVMQRVLPVLPGRGPLADTRDITL
jgi:hypothetical protein